jgi:GT2 family glycosyltransferase
MTDERPLPVYLIHWNAPEWCRSAISSILESDRPVEITIVDNGGFPDIPGVRILRQSVNRGYAGGANVALSDWLEKSAAEFCVIGSHDLHVEPTTLTTLVDRARHDSRAGIVAPNLGRSVARARRIEGERHEWASGTGLLLRRQCIKEIGLFDELLGSYVEDVELGYYARGAGWDVVIVENARAHGLGSAHPRARVLRLANQPIAVANRRGGQAAVRTLLAQPFVAAQDLLRAVTGRGERREQLQAARDRLTAFPSGASKLVRWMLRRRRTKG